MKNSKLEEKEFWQDFIDSGCISLQEYCDWLDTYINTIIIEEVE